MWKRLQEIRKRKEEIRKALLNDANVDLEAMKGELEGLESEESELRQRQEIANKLNSGELEGTEIEKPEVRSTSFAGELRTGQAVELENMTDEELVASKEYRNAFLKKLQGKKLDENEKRALTTATASVGAVVPTETLNKIIEKLRDTGVILPLVSQMQIPSNVKMPIEGANADLAWVTEGTSSTDSDDKIGSLDLGQKELIKTIDITAQVAAMSISAFEDFLVASLAKKVKRAIDNGIINGDGETQCTGILEAVTAITTAATTGFDYDDLMDMYATLPSAYAQNAVHVMNRKTLYQHIAKIKDSNKNPIFKFEADGKFTGKLNGYPVVCYDSVPDDTIIFGDFEYYFFNFVKPFEISKDTSNGFKAGKTTYRALGLVDGDVPLTEAFVVQKLKTA